MSNLNDSLSKYSIDSSLEDIIDGIQSEGYKNGLNAQEQEIFQNFLSGLLSLKSGKDLRDAILTLQKQIPLTGGEIRGTIGRSSEKLSESVDNLKAEIGEFVKSNNESTTALNRWTKVLAYATVALVFVAILGFFIR